MTRLINLGLPKSGTTTLNTALKRAGWRAGHWRFGPPRQYFGPIMYRDYFAGIDPLHSVRKFDALTQVDFVGKTSSWWPQMDAAFLRRVRHFHPDIKFLLLTRDPAKVADSILRWQGFHAKLVLRGAPGLPSPHAETRHALEEWIRGHYVSVQKQFAKDSGFLEIDIADPDARNRLEEFLGARLRWWGVANRTEEAPLIAAQ